MSSELRMQKGAATIYLTIILTSIVLGVAAGVHLIFTKQLQLVGGAGVSTLAFHAAEAGAERILRLDVCLIIEQESNRHTCIVEASDIDSSNIPNSCDDPYEPEDEQPCRTGVVDEMNVLPAAERTLANGARYDFSIRAPSGDCEGNLVWGYCATSKGSFRNTIRTVEIIR